MKRSSPPRHPRTLVVAGRFRVSQLLLRAIVVVAVVTMTSVTRQSSNVLVQGFSTVSQQTRHRIVRPQRTSSSLGSRWNSWRTTANLIPGGLQQHPRTGGGIHREQQRFFARFRWSDDRGRLSATTDSDSNDVQQVQVNDSTKNTMNNGFNVTKGLSNLTDGSGSSIFESDGAVTVPANDTAAAVAVMPLPAQSVLSVDPRMVEIVTVEDNETSTNTELEDMDDEDDEAAAMDLFRRLPFVSMFRGAANYIANHRNTLVVYHIPGELMDLPETSVLRDLMNDITLTWLLGMRIAIVVGCRHQVDQRMKNRVKHFGMSVTDAETLRIVKEEAGYVRFEVERLLARSLRMQGAGSSNKKSDSSSSASAFGMGSFDGNVVSGNFYSAQPFGILDGIDFKYSGFVRRVEVEKIRHVHRSRDIILLTTLGVSPSGEVFNVNSEHLAATVAGSLDASKLVFFTEKEVELRHKMYGHKIQNLRVLDSQQLLDLHDVKLHKKGFVNFGADSPDDQTTQDMLVKIGWSMQALRQGVKRAHIISPKHGALLQELYTRDGSGTMVSRDLYDGIRQAEARDVGCIHDLISPLIEMGTLVDRPRDVLEKTIEMYHVYTRDDLVVACGQLKLFENGYAEIGCLVVDSQYRAKGRGDAMLGYLERLCVDKGCKFVFVFSTQTMEWFIERGFDEVTVDKLPPSRQKTYNYNRASKIYMKKIDNIRDLDASELWWN